jgi:hypothetical protein
MGLAVAGQPCPLARLTKMGASIDMPILETVMNTTLRPNRINIDLQEYKQP